MTDSAAGIAHEDVVDRVAIVVTLDAHSGGSVGLGVAIDEEDSQAVDGEAGGEVDGGRGFTYSALLIDDPYDLTHRQQEYCLRWLNACRVGCGEVP